MAERPRELDQRFQGVNFRLNYRLKGYFSRHCDMTQYTQIYAYASYGNQTISSKLTRPSCWILNRDLSGCDQHCGRPSDVYDTHRRTKLTTSETISHWLLLKKRKNRSLSHPLGDLGVYITYALHLAHWITARGRLYIIELFPLPFTVETL